ncbi:hypothetical protein VULLAG_LOCUS16864 [Vulpes lagopus]
MQKTAFGSYLPTPTSLRPFQARGNLPKPAPPLPWAGPTPRNPDSYPSPPGPRTSIPHPLRGVGAAGAGGGTVACPGDQGAALRQRWPGAQSDPATPRERPNSRALSLRRAASAREKQRHIGRGRRSRLHAGSPMWDSILGPRDHTLSQRQTLKRLSLPGVPQEPFLGETE